MLFRSAFATRRSGDGERRSMAAIAMPKAKIKGHHSWTEAEVEQYRAYWPRGTEPRLVLEFAYESLSRRGEAFGATTCLHWGGRPAMDPHRPHPWLERRGHPNHAGAHGSDRRHAAHAPDLYCYRHRQAALKILACGRVRQMGAGGRAARLLPAAWLEKSRDGPPRRRRGIHRSN